MISADGWDVHALARRWAQARPFPHLVFDELLDEGALQGLREAFAREGQYPTGGEIYEFMSSSDPPQEPELRRFIGALAHGPVAEAIRAITGKPFEHVEGRAYVYGEGHYLLPHSDCRAQLQRQIAFAYYVANDSVQGGQLELFDCDVENGEIVATRPAQQIDPRPNRLVLFDVSPGSLHQVREVTSGARASIAGWLMR